MASVMSLHFIIQEEAILEDTNGKCHLCTLQSSYRPSCIHKHAPYTIIEYTHAKTLVSSLECQVS